MFRGMRCLTKVRKDFLRYSTWDFSFTIKELHQNDRADTEICLTPCSMLLPAKKSPDTATIPQAPGPVPSLFGCHSVSSYKMTGSISIRSQLVSFMSIGTCKLLVVLFKEMKRQDVDGRPRPSRHHRRFSSYSFFCQTSCHTML